MGHAHLRIFDFDPAGIRQFGGTVKNTTHKTPIRGHGPDPTVQRVDLCPTDYINLFLLL